MPNRNIDVEAVVERAVANRMIWIDEAANIPFRFMRGEPGRIVDNPFVIHPGLGAKPLRAPTVEDFNTILSNIEEIYGVKGLVAGGAVRDYTLGLPCKDVDVFIPLSIDQWKASVDELGWGGHRQAPKPYKDVKNAPIGVGRVIVNFKDLVVDVVLMGEDAPPVNVRDFPLNLQMCSYGLDGFDLSQAFYDDINNKTCTCNSTTEEMVAKYQTKFKDWTTRNNLKDWTFVKPVINQWWEKKYD